VGSVSKSCRRGFTHPLFLSGVVRPERWAPAVLLAALLLLLPTAVAAPPRSEAAGPNATTAVSATIVVKPWIPPQPISPQFWGLDVVASHPFTAADGAAVAATPITYIRFPGGVLGETFNYTTNELISPVTGRWSPANATLQQFISTCESFHCHAILQLPAEINSSSTAAYFVNYTENTLHFHPDYWEIGDAPGTWAHFNVPWSEWATVPGTNATPLPFAEMVHAYIQRIRAVDPTTPITALGIASVISDYAKPWIEDLAKIDGPELGAITLHSYAGRSGPTNGTVGTFLSSLQGPYSLPTITSHARLYIRAACPNCTHLRFFVTEINAAYGTGTYTQYLPTFNDTLFLAAEVTQGLNDYLANLDWFAFDSHFGGSWEQSPGAWQSQYYLFRDVLSLLGNETLPSSVGGPPDLFAAVTVSGARTAVLVVNANLTAPVGLNLSRAGFAPGAPLTETYWPTGAATPGNLSVPANGSSTLAPLSVAVFSGSRSPTGLNYRVVFHEAGLPTGTPWTVTLSGLSRTARQASMAFVAPNGSYSYRVGRVAGYVATPTQGNLTVRGAGIVQDITFAAQPGGGHNGSTPVPPIVTPPSVEAIALFAAGAAAVAVGAAVLTVYLRRRWRPQPPT
jgi:hypothetical protein